MNDWKVYVDVTARFDSDGIMVPLDITWEEGKLFEINHVIDICQTAAMNRMTATPFGCEAANVICSLNSPRP